MKPLTSLEWVSIVSGFCGARYFNARSAGLGDLVFGRSASAPSAALAHARTGQANIAKCGPCGERGAWYGGCKLAGQRRRNATHMPAGSPAPRSAARGLPPRSGAVARPRRPGARRQRRWLGSN
jgi:hypothetical protein